MIKSRPIQILLVLNVIVLCVLVGRWVSDRGAGQREADANITKLANNSQSLGGLKDAAFRELIEIGHRVQKEGRFTDTDLNKVLQAPNTTMSDTADARADATMWALSTLIEAKDFSPSQQQKVTAFLDPRLKGEPQTPLDKKVQLLCAKVGLRVGSPQARQTLEAISKGSDESNARMAKMLLGRLAEGKRP